MTTFWRRIRLLLNSLLQHITGWHLLAAVALYSVASYGLLTFAGETDLVSPTSHFVYYLLVTASTVGYGDLSPQTELGKYIVAGFIIPLGLTIFAFGIGHIASSVMDFSRRGLLGKRKVTVTNHILILGWNGQRTLHLIDMLLHEEKNRRPIVLCVRADIENPLPKQIEFVRTLSFTEQVAMKQTRIQEASCIIIDNHEDDITFAAALFCANLNPKAHILAYFQDEVLQNLLRIHCPNAECIPSVAVEMMAKSAVDPGSSVLHQELLSTQMGMTQYTVVYPNDAPTTTINALFLSLKQHYEPP